MFQGDNDSHNAWLDGAVYGIFAVTVVTMLASAFISFFGG